MKYCQRKIGYFTVQDVTKTLLKVKDIENDIYSVLRRSNKSFLARKVGITAPTFYNKIKARSFSLNELCRIFSYLAEFTEEEYKNSRLSRIKRIMR